MALVDAFVSQARARSAENGAAFSILFAQGHYGICIGLLRQELDTLLRAAYLWHEDTDPDEARRLLKMSAAGEQWAELSPKGKLIRITDREMLDLASHLGGWERTIYSFGSRLIHLSDAHLYRVSDPVAALSSDDRKRITDYLAQYHNAPDLDEISFNELVLHLPSVMQKLLGNVEFYLEELKERYGTSAA